GDQLRSLPHRLHRGHHAHRPVPAPVERRQPDQSRPAWRRRARRAWPGPPARRLGSGPDVPRSAPGGANGRIRRPHGADRARPRVRTGRPMLLTEHGIYARERRSEIDQAEWIYVQRQGPMSLSAGPGFFKDLWTRLFVRLSQLTYEHADLIVTIFEGNRQAQIRD